MRTNIQRQDCAVLAGCLIGLWLVSTFMLTRSAWSAEFKVFVEGAYTDDTLIVQIYANTDTFKMASAGVKLSYDLTRLTVIRVTKNESLWSISDGGAKFPYMEPDISKPGEVIIIAGKLDLSNPSQGVCGERVLLAEVEFERNEHPKVPPILDVSTVSLDYARSGSYCNFVTVEGKVLDHDCVTFGSFHVGPVGLGGNIVQRGDANGNGSIEATDIDAITRYQKDGGNAHEWMDCNNDGRVNVLDIACIQNKLTNAR
ncbi:MAG: dockerin type I repeat-containing protein [bacterium]